VINDRYLERILRLLARENVVSESAVNGNSSSSAPSSPPAPPHYGRLVLAECC
jgi:hypothetical protein